MTKIKKYTYKKIKGQIQPNKLKGGMSTFKAAGQLGQAINYSTGKSLNIGSIGLTRSLNTAIAAVNGITSTGLSAVKVTGRIADRSVITFGNIALTTLGIIDTIVLKLRMSTMKYDTEYRGLIEQLAGEYDISIKNLLRGKIIKLVKKKIKGIKNKFNLVKRTAKRQQINIKLEVNKSLKKANCKRSFLNQIRGRSFNQRSNCPLKKFEEVLKHATALNKHLDKATELIVTTKGELDSIELDLDINKDAFFSHSFSVPGSDPLSKLVNSLNEKLVAITDSVSSSNPELKRISESFDIALADIKKKEEEEIKAKLEEEKAKANAKLEEEKAKANAKLVAEAKA